MMDPTIGRWTTKDPDGFTAEDMNLYRYCENNPTNATDPTGLLEWQTVGLAGLTIVSPPIGLLAGCAGFGSKTKTDGSGNFILIKDVNNDEKQGAEKYRNEHPFDKPDDPKAPKTINKKTDLTNNFKVGSYFKFVLWHSDDAHPKGELKVMLMERDSAFSHFSLAKDVAGSVWSAGWLKLGDDDIVEFDTVSGHYGTDNNEEARNRAYQALADLGFRPVWRDPLAGKPTK
jgi:hypothetical protein